MLSVAVYGTEEAASGFVSLSGNLLFDTCLYLHLLPTNEPGNSSLRLLLRYFHVHQFRKPNYLVIDKLILMVDWIRDWGYVLSHCHPLCSRRMFARHSTASLPQWERYEYSSQFQSYL